MKINSATRKLEMFTEDVDGRIKAEYFMPGDYYSGNVDPGFSLKCQVIFNY